MAAADWIPVSVPDLGAETIQVVQWLLDAPADVVEGDRVLELLADGVLFHLSADATGVLIQQDCRRGGLVATGETLGWIKPAGS